MATLLLGGGSVALGTPPLQRVHDLLNGIFEDVAAIVSSFAGGPNDPHSPVVDRSALTRDKARLDGATDKASQLAGELARLRPGNGTGPSDTNTAGRGR